jgi:hypothetical protein
MLDYYTKLRDWTRKPNIAKRLRRTLVDYKLLLWATQSLTSIAEFSIVNDVDGVISTTLGKIIPMHIYFYEVSLKIKFFSSVTYIFILFETVEELLLTIKSPKMSLYKFRRGELEMLINLLKEYRKSLVFFHLSYSAFTEYVQDFESNFANYEFLMT